MADGLDSCKLKQRESVTKKANVFFGNLAINCQNALLFILLSSLVPFADRLYQDLCGQSMTTNTFFVFFLLEQRGYLVNVDGTRSWTVVNVAWLCCFCPLSHFQEESPLSVSSPESIGTWIHYTCGVGTGRRRRRSGDQITSSPVSPKSLAFTSSIFGSWQQVFTNLIHSSQLLTPCSCAPKKLDSSQQGHLISRSIKREYFFFKIIFVWFLLFTFHVKRNSRQREVGLFHPITNF